MEALNDGAGDSPAGELFEGFVEEIARVEVGGDEDVGLALERGIRGLFGGDGGVYCGFELEFAVDEVIWVGSTDLADDRVDFSEVRVLAAGTMSGIR